VGCINRLIRRDIFLNLLLYCNTFAKMYSGILELIQNYFSMENKMETPKKVWQEPQLTVLSRGTPEESVLSHCKIIGTLLLGAIAAFQDGCNDTIGTNCGTCQSRSGS
jgi:hypothetical protein